jgi:hypothetical protein
MCQAMSLRFSSLVTTAVTTSSGAGRVTAMTWAMPACPALSPLRET